MSIVKSPIPVDAQLVPAEQALGSVRLTLMTPPQPFGHPAVAEPPQSASTPTVTNPPLTVMVKPGGRALGTG